MSQAVYTLDLKAMDPSQYELTKNSENGQKQIQG